MAIKLKEFITNLAKKAGFDTESETAKPFFAALPDTDVPDDVQKGIDNSLLSLTEAKNNFPDIKNHYTKQALDGMDKEILALIDAFQLDDDSKNLVLAEKSTYKRAPLLTRTIVELERKKAGTTGDKGKQEVQKQIDELQAQLKLTKEAAENEKKSFDQQRLQDRINAKKNVFFSGMKTIHDDLDPEIRYSILDTLISKSLQDNQAKLAFDDNGNLVLLRNDGTNYFGENHQQVKPAQFIEQVLAKNKQLKVTDSSSNGSNGAKPQNGAQPSGSSGGGTKDQQTQSGVIDRNKQALADYEKSLSTGPFGG